MYMYKNSLKSIPELTVETHPYTISFSDHYILSGEYRVIVDLVHTNYHGRPMVLKSVRCDRAFDYEGSSLWSDVFQVS